VLYVGVLEKVDGEGMQNLMTNPSDFLVNGLGWKDIPPPFFIAYN
jgi:hypothetical protein